MEKCIVIFFQMCVLVCLGCLDKISPTGCFKEHKFISHTSRDGKSEIKVLADEVSGEDSPSSF